MDPLTLYAITAGLGSSIGGMFNSAGKTSVYKSGQLMSMQLSANKQYAQWLNENSYSQMRKGLETAGYNPLLAVGSGASPSSASLSTPTANSGNNAQYSLMDTLTALNSLAELENKTADTESKRAGLITKFLGTKLGKRAQAYGEKMFNGIENTAKAFREVSDEIGSGVLKGYVSNTANSNTPNELPKSMYTYQPDYDSQGSLDNAELQELKMIKKINRRRNRYGL